MKPETTVLTQKELAARWQISHKTLERWRWLGEGPRFFKFGGAVRYKIEDIEAYEKAAERQSTSVA